MGISLFLSLLRWNFADWYATFPLQYLRKEISSVIYDVLHAKSFNKYKHIFERELIIKTLIKIANSLLKNILGKSKETETFLRYKIFLKLKKSNQRLVIYKSIYLISKNSVNQLITCNFNLKLNRGGRFYCAKKLNEIFINLFNFFFATDSWQLNFA